LGIKIGLHYSWFLIALLLVLSLSANFRTSHPQWSTGLVLAVATATAILFFLSLLLHELSHSLVARARGLPVREITLFALGGVSQIERDVASATTEFWMALVGPLTSVLIGLTCLATARIVNLIASGPLEVILSWLGYINLGLAAFNMLPGYPMDGGRILRAIIWWKTGDVDRSTRVAARAAQAVATVFISIGLIEFFSGAGIGGLWISFIGWFLFQAAGESYLEIGLKRDLEAVRVGDVMTRNCPTVDGDQHVQDFVDNELLRTGRRCFVVVDNGRVAGLITPHEVKSLPREKWPATRLDEVMCPLEKMRIVDPDATLASALLLMGRDDVNQLPVLSNGRLEGVLSRAEILGYLQTRTELMA
jgi:Zn-dependent protease/predicted transcriptional regulator